MLTRNPAIRCCWRQPARASTNSRATSIGGASSKKLWRVCRRSLMALRLKTDWVLFTTIILMVFFGAVMIYSASSVKAEQRLGSSYYYIERQMFWVAISLVVMMLLKRVSYRKLQHPGVAFACMGVVLILLVIVFFADPKQHRWIKVAGMSLQPSEFAKPGMMLFLAFFVVMRGRAVNNPPTPFSSALARG